MDIYQIISLIISFIASIVSLLAILITVSQNKKVIKQNNEIIESSNRPYLGIYFKTIYIGNQAQNFLILKNFGKTVATIHSFNCSIDLENFLFTNKYNPFKHLFGVMIFPSQTFTTPIDGQKMSQDHITNITFTISYSPQYTSKTFTEEFTINYTFYRNNIYVGCPKRNGIDNTEGELRNISEILHRDLIEKL